MAEADPQYGKPNPRAPAELSRFPFLIGKWRCGGKIRNADGQSQSYNATWIGRYILDGYVTNTG